MARKQPPVKQIIIRKARKYGIDPAAAIAVAMGEGGLRNRSGDVGDLAGGGSYGPFQLYAQGALPKKFRGNAAAADRWAWSPAGIDYAIRKMKEAGASGLRGEAAVQAIVRKFERPADPDTSVARAIERLGNLGKLSAAPTRQLAAGQPKMPGGVAALPGAIPPAAVGTLNDIFKKVGLPTLDIVGDLPLPQATPTPSVPGRPLPPQAGAAPAQLPTPIPKGTKLPKVKRMVDLIGYAQKLGLSVRENPFTDQVDPVHVKGSHHYQTIGKYKGKPVGKAMDVSGDPEALRKFWAYAAPHADDMFWDPMGYSIDRGKRWNKTLGDHGDHLHFSLR